MNAAKAILAAWAVLLLFLRMAEGGAPSATAPPELPQAPFLIKADIFAREGADILYAIGKVHLERGDVVVTCDAAVLWTAQGEGYLEGHVLYRTGKSVMEAERAYVRWADSKDEKTGKMKTVVNRGFFFNSVIRWAERPDQVTWQIRAEEVLQTDVRQFKARGSLVMSPCQFQEPHAFFRASEIELVTDEHIIASDLMYFVRGVSLPPIWVFPTYWPKLYIPLGWEWPQVNIEFSSSSRFGFYIRTDIVYELEEKLFGFLKSEVGVKLDYFSKRGFAYGASLDYRSDNPPGQTVLGRDLIRGRIEAYRVPDDTGTDRGKFTLGTTDRYLAKLTHSQDVPEGWEFDLEAYRLSDSGFIHEYFPRSYETVKPLENRAYLRYATGPFAAYFHLKWRNEKFFDSTSYLPQVGFNIFSYPIAGNLLYTGHFEFANITRRLSELRLAPGQLPTDPVYEAIRRKWNFYFGGDPTYPILPLESTPQEYASDGRRLFRFNTFHQLSYPFDVSIFHFEPFAAWRGTWYSDTLEGGGGFRSFLAYGARVNTQFWRSWEDVRIDRPLLQVDGIRHVITPEIRFLNIEKPSITADKLILTDDFNTDFFQPPRNNGYAFPLRPYRPLDTTALAFGDIDAIVPVRLINFSFRNRWQTRREGRPADLLEITPNVTYYLDPSRDNWGKSRGDWSIHTRFSPVYGVYTFFDFGRKVSGDLLGKAQETAFYNFGLCIEVSDRWSFLFSQRQEVGYSTHTAFHLVHQISKKWRFDIQYEFDTKRNFNRGLTFHLTRDLHDWLVDFVIQQDTSGLQNMFGIGLSPKGRRELVTGLQFTRDLRAGLDAHHKEAYQHFDY